MGQGIFEEEIKEKFEGTASKVSAKVWDNIEANLNQGLITTYATTNKRYKWVAAAAIFIAFLSFGYHLVDFEDFKQTSPYSDDYNALLQQDYSYVDAPKLDWTATYTPIFRPVIVEKESNSSDGSFVMMEDYSEVAVRSLHTEILAPKGYVPPELQLEMEIYPYHKAPAYRQLSKEVRRDDNALWAGLEAGAGNFNSFNSSSLSSGVDPVSLASAIGNDGFINPTTLVNPELNNGVATSLGLDFGMNLTDKWTLEAGLAYTNVESNGRAAINVLDSYTISTLSTSPLDSDEKVIGLSSRETEVQVEENYDHNVQVSSSTQFTSVPVKAGYYLVNQRVSLKLNLGFAANYFVTSELTGGDGIINGSFNDSFNQWSFDGMGGIEIGYSVFQNFDFILEPNYRQAITPMNIGSGANTSRFLVQTGLKYTLK